MKSAIQKGRTTISHKDERVLLYIRHFSNCSILLRNALACLDIRA